MRISEDEFLALWKRHRGYETLRNDASVTRADGIGLDELLREQAAAWYDRLLREGPAGAVVEHDITDALYLERRADGSVTADLPDGLRRLTCVRLRGWQADALIVAAGSPEALRQRNAWSRGGAQRPVAVVGEGRVELFTAVGDGEPVLERCTAVMLPPTGYVELQPMAVALIEEYEPNNKLNL